MSHTELSQHITQKVESLFAQFEAPDLALLKDNERFHAEVAETYQELRNEVPELSLEAYIMMIMSHGNLGSMGLGSGQQEYLSRMAEKIRSKVEALLPDRQAQL